jgi:hypothetical protein
MITETVFIGCENVPEEMAGAFDRPWHFLGEVKADHWTMLCYCGKCNAPDLSYTKDFEFVRNEAFMTVILNAHLFITGDMLEVVVFFGICKKCQSVYWARSGPPFKRARAYANAFA